MSPSAIRRPIGLGLAVLVAILVLASPIFAAVPGGVRGTVTTQAGSVFLPGVTVTIAPAGTAGVPPTLAVSDGSGRFDVANLAPGDYLVTVALDGFDGATQKVRVEAGRAVELTFDLGIAKFSQSVDVVEHAPAPAATATKQAVSGDLVQQAPIRGDNFQALLPLLPSVVRGADGRMRVAGGDPTQSGLQVSSASVTDPSTGDFALDLPADAVDSVQVLENPYSSEYGRFSSGVTQIQTRKGGDRWQFIPNGFIPRIRIVDGGFRGIEAFTPRASIGGPLVRNKVFVSQSLQYRLVRSDVKSLPGDPYSEVRSFDSYSRLDANLSSRHTLTGAFAVYPRTIDAVNLSTFTPPAATPTFRQGGFNAGATERAILSPKALLETTVNFKRYDVDVFGQGEQTMELAPAGVSGNYFNRQARNSQTLQAVSVLTMTPNEAHVVKVGADVMAAGYDGTSASAPVEIRRLDGTLAQRLSFAGPTRQRVTGADAALFAQDEWRAAKRVMIEGGIRLDRDGALGRVHVSPRSGVTVSLNENGSAVLRGGVGLFYQRTPLNVAAFGSMERRTLTAFASDGLTPVSEVAFTNATATLDTPRAVVGNVEYDHQVSDALLLKVNLLRRHGADEFLVTPQFGPAPSLLLASTGRSDHWETEVTARLRPKEGTDLTFSYVRSRSETDLNSFDSYFGNFRNPVIVTNQYSLTNTDVPHRFLARGTIGLPSNFEVAPVIEVRSGFPYSFVGETQDIVGVRNTAGRFPLLATLDLGVQRRMKVRGVKMRAGVRMFNLLNTFNPRDVQSNVAAPDFGFFYNPIPRSVGLIFWIDR